MRKIKLLAMVAASIAIMLPTAVGAAGEDYAVYYDFDEYTAEVASNPSERPEGFVNGTSYGFPRAIFGSADCSDEERGRVLSIKAGETSLMFDQKLTEGKLHISYDAKATDPNLSMLTHFHNDSGGTNKINNNNYSKTFFVNSGTANTLSYYTGMTNWEKKVFSSNFSSTEWHHYDIIADGITEKGSTVKEYVDGELVYKWHSFTGTNGIFDIVFRVETGNTPAPSDDARFYIDNLMVRSYSKDTALAAIAADGDRINSSDAVIRVRLSEKVDKNLLTDKNILVSASGSLPAYTVKNVTDMGFDIDFTGSIPYGKYTVSLDPSVQGKLTGTSLKYPLEVKTEERWADADVDFANFNFNSYKEAGKLPDGFVGIDTNDNPFAAPAINSSASDYALSFKGFEGSSRSRTSMFVPFGASPQLGAEYSIEFDVKSKDMRWYLYIPEEGEIQNNTTSNVALAADENGALKYAKSKSTNATDNIGSGVNLSADAWHTIKINVVPDTKQQKTAYKLTVDGVDEYVLETSRNLHSVLAEGIGFGYQQRSADAELYLDNVKVSGKANVKYPEVEYIKLFDANGNEAPTDGTVTTLINKAVIKFNSYVAKNCTDKIKLYLDSNETEYDYEMITNDDKSNSVVIKFDNMLEPLTKYEISAKKGIESVYTPSISTYTEESIVVYTSKDSDYSVSKLEYNDDKKAAEVEFVKNNSAEGDYIFAVCAYKNVTTEKDGETVTIKKLVGIRYMPIDISADMLGVVKYTLPFETEEGEADEFVPYLWNYPSLTDTDI